LGAEYVEGVGEAEGRIARPGPERFPPIRSQERKFGWVGGWAEVLGGGRRLEGRELGWEWREEVVESL